ncbi:Ribosomal Protein S6 Kinase-Like 1 [Manis pentadactyla]|nr:Ribosomal Protein S6 Kinase-Like 1 [Manis pentadactyla]
MAWHARPSTLGEANRQERERAELEARQGARLCGRDRAAVERRAVPSCGRAGEAPVERLD